MYIYKELEKAKRRKRIWGIFLTFIFAVSGSYLVQTYLTSRAGSEGNNDVERLSDTDVVEENIEENKSREDIIQEVMKSVVGISAIKANEESLFDVELPEKWGLRHRCYCFK